MCTHNSASYSSLIKILNSMAVSQSKYNTEINKGDDDGQVNCFIRCIASHYSG